MSDAEKWVSVGEQLSQLVEENLFRSSTVNGFLQSDRKTIMLSAKGMGKTHLLRQKRKLLTSAKDKSARFIPESTAIDLDRIRRFPPNLPASTWTELNEDEWCALWEIAIACSILLNYPLDLDDTDTSSRLVDLVGARVLPERVAEFFLDKLNGGTVRAAVPSYIINELLLMNFGQRKTLLKLANNLIVQFYRNYVNSAVYVFLDAVDQALSEADIGNRALWVAGQTGLARAAYDMQSNNNHIKVFTSIRQEAWSAFENENKASIESYCVHLSYTKEELRRMISVLTKYYHGVEDIGSILKTVERNIVHNYGVVRKGSKPEDLFDYLYRHSVGTPRSLIHIINAIVYNCDEEVEPATFERSLRHEVNLMSGYVAETKIQSEMAHFLEFLGRDDRRREFFSRIDRNVLTSEDLHGISEKVFGRSDAHPFCELYNMGLLGCLHKNTDGRLVQTFKSPNNFDWRGHKLLPASDLYVLHPALEAFLSRDYRLNVEANIVVGNGDEWRAAWTAQVQQGTICIFLSYSSDDLGLKTIVERAIDEFLSSAGVRYRLWTDHRQIAGGEVIAEGIDRALDDAHAMVCIVTKSYNLSKWCMAEFEAMRALCLSKGARKRILLPFIFEGGERRKLGHLSQGTLVPDIDYDDAASLAKIGQALERFWRPKGE